MFTTNPLYPLPPSSRFVQAIMVAPLFERLQNAYALNVTCDAEPSSAYSTRTAPRSARLPTPEAFLPRTPAFRSTNIERNRADPFPVSCPS
ncbi:MAG: hypothetical protein ABFC38_02395 [Methanospirillum sp.]